MSELRGADDERDPTLTCVVRRFAESSWIAQA